MKRILLTFVTTFLLSLPCAASQLGSTWHGSVGASTSTVVVHLQIGNGCFLSGACDEFFTQSFTSSSVGTTVSIDANSYAGFANLASLLTNGVPDNIFQTGTTPQGAGGGNGGPEYLQFSLPVGTDFSGNTITDLQFTVTAYQAIPQNNFNRVGFDLVVNGFAGVADAPEPSTGVLIGACLIGLGTVSRRRSAHR